MHPIVIDNPPIGSYGVLMLAAIVIGWLWTRRRAPKFGIAAHHIDAMAPLVVAAGLVGAWASEKMFGDGRVLYGALICSVVTGIAYCVTRRLELGRMGDAFAPPLALSIGIGRVGCYFAGCCWGRACGEEWWALHFPPGSFAYHEHASHGWIADTATQSLGIYPVQIMEAAGATMLAVWLVVWGLRWQRSGEIFLMMAVGYAGLRAVLEVLRADNPPISGTGLTLSQWISLSIIAACVITGISRRCLYADTPGTCQPKPTLA